jgi:hypothetical protein
MPGVIVLSDQVLASNSDILQGTRLQTVPMGGFLTFEFSAEECSQSNNAVVSVQMPNGDTPLNDVLVPFNGYSATDGVLHSNTKMQITLPVQQGGHAVVSITETGTTVVTYRITYTPA